MYFSQVTIVTLRSACTQIDLFEAYRILKLWVIYIQ